MAESTAIGELFKALARKEFSEKGAEEYLKTKGFGNDEAKAAVEEAVKKHYIDDTAFAKMLIAQKGRSKSKAELKFVLQTKGVKSEVIADLLKDKEAYAGEASAVQKAVKLFFMTHDVEDTDDINTVKRRLINRGFSLSEITSAINAVKEGEN
ncbi:MAG: RecX family transcriptional regulator [Christensenellaceae bacterium]|nr:RecX family transcriptional regulator [Christensenellaceae bacterium]